MNTLVNPLFILADNQAATAAGLRYYLSTLLPEAPVAAAVGKAELAALLSPRRDAPTVVVLDYTLFDFAGVDELLIFLRRFPAVRWVLFSNELSEGLIRRVSAETKVSMILKDNSGEEIGAALRCAARGERFLCHQVVNLLLTPVSAVEQSPLTASEREILRLVARGMSVKEIALERHSSVHTITSHKKNIFRKIGVNNVYEAMQYARRAGLADEDYTI